MIAMGIMIPHDLAPTPDPVPDPVPDPTPDPVPVPAPEMTPEQHAEACWSWLRAQCAPSTWKAFTRSVAVRQPESKSWSQ